MDEFKPVSDDQSVTPEPSETVFVESDNGEAAAQDFGSEPSSPNPFSLRAKEDNTENQGTSESPIPLETRVEAVPAKPSLWVQFRQLIHEDPVLVLKRIRDIDQAIERTPNGATNYVLRGELYLQIHEYELALADFEQGLALAETEYDSSRWGVVSQAVRDRALKGQQKAARKLKRKRKVEGF